MKKVLSITLAIIMVFATMSTAVFAEGEQKQFPNVYADVWTDNIDCIHSEDADVSLKITNKNNSQMTPIIIQLKYNDDYGSYVFEGRDEDIDPIIKDIAINEEVMKAYTEYMAGDTDDSFDILDKAGYQVAVIVEDNDADHEFTVGEIDSSILTEDFIKEFTETLTYLMMKVIIEESTDEEVEVIAELFGGVNLLIKDDAIMIVKEDGSEEKLLFSNILDLMKDEEMAKEMELDEEDLAAIKEYEAMMEALGNGTYAGELIIDINLECGCPVLNEYTLYHEYYGVNGEYIDQTSVDKKVPEGSVVKIEDIKLLEKYDGKEYRFDGLYIVDEDGECDWNKPVNEFTVPMANEDSYLEVVVRYVAVGEAAGSGGPGDEDVMTPIDKGETDDSSKPVDTGDDFNVLPFAVVMLLAALGMGAAVVRRRA